MVALKKGWMKDLNIVMEPVYELTRFGKTYEVNQATFDYMVANGLIEGIY